MSQTLRVLFVEDNPDDMDLLHMELERGGYDVVSERVETREALDRALDNGTWDLILSDYHMPRFDGRRALDAVRARDPDVPFILVSGRIGEDVAVEAMRAGANDYLLKGNLKRLNAAIDRELSEAASRRARMAAERDLKRSKEYNRALLEAIPDLILRLRRDGAVLDGIAGDPSRQTMRPQTMVGRRIHDVAPRQLVEQVMGTIDETLRYGGTRSIDFDVEADGNRHAYEARLATCGPDEVLAIIRNVTEQRNMEAQMRAAQRMEAVGRLAGGVAHDFNNILTVIQSYVGFLRSEFPEEGPLRSDVNAIGDAAERASRLTHQLLAFSRRQIQELQVVDLNTEIGELEKMLRRLIGEDIELVMTLEEGLGLVKTDPTHLEQVIMNLVVNARQAMPEGGALNIETMNLRIDDEYGRKKGVQVAPGDYVVLKVSDTGMGMDEETASQIFEPFFTTKKKGEGTGLGLATVYGIVKQSRGFIWVSSEPDVGTVFEILLPRTREPERALRGRPSIPTAVRGTETILLVEDEPALRRAARRMLEQNGYQVLEAGHGEEALPLFERHHHQIALLLTDVVMPVMGGPQLARRLNAFRSDLPVVYMSGYTDNEIGRHGVLQEGTIFVQKPFTEKSLLRTVRDALDDAKT